jgi:hypothetical protein
MSTVGYVGYVDMFRRRDFTVTSSPVLNLKSSFYQKKMITGKGFIFLNLSPTTAAIDSGTQCLFS